MIAIKKNHLQNEKKDLTYKALWSAYKNQTQSLLRLEKTIV